MSFHDLKSLIVNVYKFNRTETAGQWLYPAANVYNIFRKIKPSELIYNALGPIWFLNNQCVIF